MARSVLAFFHSISSTPFVVQFVMAVTVGENDCALTQIASYLIPAESESDVREKAKGMIESLSDSFRNSDGQVVNITCLGVHSIDEIDYVDEDARVELGVFQFSKQTCTEHLLQNERYDLPLLE